MRKFLLLITLLTYLPTFAQVGIGTTSPDTDLHVAGSMLVQKEFNINQLDTVASTDEDFKLLTRIKNSSPVGEISKLDVDNLTVAPINLVNYRFHNLLGDNLTDVNLQLDTDKYIVGIANFRYIGDAVQKLILPGDDGFGNFVLRVFESGGEWHLEIGNRFLDPLIGGTVEYQLTLIIYDKSYYRKLDPIFTDMNGSNTGVASSIPDIN